MCPTPLKTRKAKLLEPNLAQALLGAALSNMLDAKTIGENG